jgi:hypothetical protein
MVWVLASSEVDRGFESQLVFVTSPLKTQHKGERTKIWLARKQDNVSE